VFRTVRRAALALVCSLLGYAVLYRRSEPATRLDGGGWVGLPFDG
jgi:hypothetical protein